MISWRMTAAWLVALVVATLLTWQIVGLAESQVGESPVAMAPTLSTEPMAESTSSSPTTTAASATSTSSPPSTSTSSGAAPTTGAASTSPTSSPTTTSAATGEWSVRTVNSPGGSVVFRHRPGEVELQAATPAPGFAVEVEDEGPDRVRVDFEGEPLDIRVEARWENGSLVVDVDD